MLYSPLPAVRVPEYVSDYIQVVEGVLSPAQCAGLIRRFELSAPYQVPHSNPGFAYTGLDLTQHWPEVASELEETFKDVARGYAANIGMQQWWTEPFPLGPIRMKRYLPGTGDAFPLHLDVRDRFSAVRSLAMFVYLNDVDKGGETAFPQWEIAIKPEAGKMLAFPPGFPYVHEGRPPISGPKYIVATYAFYP